MDEVKDSRNMRGNTKDRKVRKQWLLDTFGDGTEAPCSFEGCTIKVNFHTITVDRYPIPGIEGGRYIRGNIRPACQFHNSQDGSFIAQSRRMMREMEAAKPTQEEREDNDRELPVPSDGDEVQAQGRSDVQSGEREGYAISW